MILVCVGPLIPLFTFSTALSVFCVASDLAGLSGTVTPTQFQSRICDTASNSHVGD